jgi:L-alanine-DL-glutamate epimerase-like enolase superfamily enzyme
LHLNAYLMHSLYLEYNVSSSSLLRNLCKQPIEMIDGEIEVPDGPGLGVGIDEAMIERYRVA